jgi:catecholate siderophore receptor
VESGLRQSAQYPNDLVIAAQQSCVGSTGGVINQVSKQPQLAPITAAAGTVGTDRTFRFTTDIGRPIEGLENSAFLNGMPARDAAEYRRFGIAPSVAFGIGTDTRLTRNYFHLQEDNVPDYGLPWFFASPAPVTRHNFLRPPQRRLPAHPGRYRHRQVRA